MEIAKLYKIIFESKKNILIKKIILILIKKF